MAFATRTASIAGQTGYWGVLHSLTWELEACEIGLIE
jgi:hypothetical protein